MDGGSRGSSPLHVSSPDPNRRKLPWRMAPNLWRWHAPCRISPHLIDRWVTPVTCKLVGELEGFGIFPSSGNSRSQAGTVDSLFCRKCSALRVVDGVESTYRPGQIREILDQMSAKKSAIG